MWKALPGRRSLFQCKGRAQFPVRNGFPITLIGLSFLHTAIPLLFGGTRLGTPSTFRAAVFRTGYRLQRHLGRTQKSSCIRRRLFRAGTVQGVVMGGLRRASARPGISSAPHCQRITRGLAATVFRQRRSGVSLFGKCPGREGSQRSRESLGRCPLCSSFCGDNQLDGVAAQQEESSCEFDLPDPQRVLVCRCDLPLPFISICCMYAARRRRLRAEQRAMIAHSVYPPPYALTKFLQPGECRENHVRQAAFSVSRIPLFIQFSPPI